MSRRFLLLFVFVLLMLVACQPQPVVTPTPTPTPRMNDGDSASEVVPTEETEVPIQTEAPAEDPTHVPIVQVGPENYPENVNPLTGLVVEDLSVLDRPPLIIKISNSPSIVRPQAGLNSADHVWEHYMEGWRIATRYAAVFLTNTPERVGSVRSGRLPDLELVPMYEAIYFASGFSSNRNAPSGPPRMNELMRSADWMPRNFSYEFGYQEPYGVRIPYADGSFDEHTLFAVPEELWKLAEERGIGASTTLSPGLVFYEVVPDGGTSTESVVVNYPGSGANNTWEYDEASGTWLLWTADEVHGDALTGEQVAFHNVVLVYAEHYQDDFVETEPNWYGVGVDLVGSGPATLLREGLRYDLTWRREMDDSMIQFYNEAGEIFSFKPGRTWFHMISENYEPAYVAFDPES